MFNLEREYLEGRSVELNAAQRGRGFGASGDFLALALPDDCSAPGGASKTSAVARDYGGKVLREDLEGEAQGTSRGGRPFGPVAPEAPETASSK